MKFWAYTLQLDSRKSKLEKIPQPLQETEFMSASRLSVSLLSCVILYSLYAPAVLGHSYVLQLDRIKTKWNSASVLKIVDSVEALLEE